MASTSISRRNFVRTATVGTAAVLAAPAVLTAKKTASLPIVGSGEHQYEVLHHWPQLPDSFSWQVTHNVAIDSAGNLYVIHEGNEELTDHPAIFVFDPEGKFIRAFGQQFQGGGHGLEVRQEGNEEFLYVTGYKALKTFVKLTLTGETVWQKFAPMESGLYAAEEVSKPENVWGRDRFMPTNFAFLDDSLDDSLGGGFFLADGYGTHRIHRYDNDANYVSTFGQPGDKDGEFNLPHGLWTDQRPGREPSVVVADRVNSRLQWFSLEGKHLETLDGFLLPANVDTFGELMLVPDLKARVTILDGQNKVVAQLGDDEAWRANVLADGFALRKNPDQWVDGKFLHPHDACFDAAGNIFLAEWVATGRITKLRKVS